MTKFKPGDPVWVRSNGSRAAPGEYAGVVTGVEEHGYYHVDIPACRHPLGCEWTSHERFLRPRRDDYQQREPLGSRRDLDLILKEPSHVVLDKETV